MLSARGRKSCEYSIKFFQQAFLCYFSDVKELAKTNDEYNLSDLTSLHSIKWSFFTINEKERTGIVIGRSSRKKEDINKLTNEIPEMPILQTKEFLKVNDCWVMVLVDGYSKWWHVDVFNCEGEFLENFQSIEIMPRVRSQEYVKKNINVANEVDKVINQIYSSTNIEVEKRMQFMSLIWVMLQRDEFRYAEVDGKPMCLREYMDWLDDLATKEKTDEERERLNPIFDRYGGAYFFEACKRLYRLKVASNVEQRDERVEDEDDGRKLNKFQKYLKGRMKIRNEQFVEDVCKKQLAYLEGIIDSFNETNVRTNALAYAGMIYDRIYKPFGKEYDFLKAVFDGESKYFKGAVDGSFKRGQAYTHMIVKHLLMFVMKKNIVEDGKRKAISMMDPTCGTGGFAHAFMKYVERWNREEGECVRLNVYENELESALANIAFLEGFTNEFNVLTFNFDIFDQRLKKYVKERSVDYVFMNPPYGVGKMKDINQGFDGDFKWSGEDRLVRNVKKTEMTFYRYSVENFGKLGGWFA